jgi:hypothetical protein
MQSSGKKDARYLASLFRPHLDSFGKNHPVSENQLLRKYGGLMWKDPDSTKTKYFLADNNNMKWYRLTKNNGGGWALIAYDQFYDKATKEDQEQHMEPWMITEDLISCIEEYYTVLNPNSEVKIIKLRNDSDSKQCFA